MIRASHAPAGPPVRRQRCSLHSSHLRPLTQHVCDSAGRRQLVVQAARDRGVLSRVRPAVLPSAKSPSPLGAAQPRGARPERAARGRGPRSPHRRAPPRLEAAAAPAPPQPGAPAALAMRLWVLLSLLLLQETLPHGEPPRPHPRRHRRAPPDLPASRSAAPARHVGGWRPSRGVGAPVLRGCH